ncbi:SWIM zinc finger family protein [Streptomyces sp. NPDC002564]|uniref:SWIM zinc finger family protein n=1 Tax=Streptomyces sp. NPDC002564 TaxID=3364649 RepID=UPI0036747420
MSETSRMGSGRVFPALPAHPDPAEPFAASWWGNAWIDALEESALDQARLARGRAYAREGAVDTITVAPGRIVAYVHGSRPRPYRAEIRLRTMLPEHWDRFLDAVATDPAHIAALLDKEMPHALADAATRADVPLLPGGRELAPSCTCPDRGHPCKHAAALAYQTARLLDADPFVLLLLRGGEEGDLLDELSRRNARRAVEEEADARRADHQVRHGALGDSAERHAESGPTTEGLRKSARPDGAPSPHPLRGTAPATPTAQAMPTGAATPTGTERPVVTGAERPAAVGIERPTLTGIESPAATGSKPATLTGTESPAATGNEPPPATATEPPTTTSLPAPAATDAPTSPSLPTPPGVLAREVLATEYRSPLPAPLAPPPHPGRPPVLPEASGAPDPMALEFLVTDAAARAHAFLTAGTDPFTATSPWHDAVRLAASHPGLTGRRTFSRQFAELAGSVGSTAAALSRAAAAWRQGGEEGLAVLETPWDPPAGPFDRARGALISADLPRMTIHRNHLTNEEGTLQLRYGRDGRWYPYESEPGAADWWPEGEPDTDPVGAVTGMTEV